MKQKYMAGSRLLLPLGALCSTWLVLGTASADPALRVQMDLEGDFVMFGNTLAHECATGMPTVPAPIVGTIGNCPNDNSYAPDVFWRSDDPADGQARADSSLGPDEARSTAVLVLPAGAEVAYARLYWGALSAAAGPDETVRVQRPSSNLDTEITQDGTARQNDAMTGRFWYQSTADVTALVRAQGPGPYRIAGVESVDIVGLGDTHPVAGWFMVVFYTLDGQPSRNLAIFDGMDLVDQAIADISVALSGFLVPNAGFNARLGVAVYEGEAQLTGDSMSFNSMTLSNALNPANNFFNATRTNLGNATTTVGDLPQLTGTPRSLSNMDLDVVDVTSLVSAGQTMATIGASSTQDTFVLAAFVTSISTLRPEFFTSNKNVTDLNGGAVRPGDELQYTIEAENSGSDTSVNTVLSDPLPAGVSYVAGSLEVTSGANTGAKTDDAGDDQGEYDSATRTVRVRIGDGANATAGGTLEIGASTTVRFRVTVDATASGTISNEAVITAEGEQGSPTESTVTDGDIVDPGQQPTDVTIDACQADADCAAPTPFCDVASSPKVCVECVTSAHCTNADTPDCNFTTHVCECASGATCADADGDGISDDAEEGLGSDPDDADSDDDGVPDGSELAPDRDSDGDGLINVLDADSDDDALFDGTELGLDCDGDDVDLARGNCIADADMGTTTTSPVDADTDDGGARDGSEDFDRNGRVDAGETDPTVGMGGDDAGVTDTDGDGLSDGLETDLHSDPNDADTDDDGALDGQEANPSADDDGDELTGVLDVDSDDDGLFDGTELGKGCGETATDQTLGHCRADNDGGATQTSPLLRDTDGGGVSDGSEDSNLNGIVDGSETNPVAGQGADDTGATDTDGDGLSDGLEATLGTDPNDADSDDDGALDGQEANPSDDHDGDGDLNALDTDSDDDGLFDGTELGVGCDDADTARAAASCRPDQDAGATRTSPVNADTDFGGRSDGAEDANRNGQVDATEGDPNDPRDDRVGEPCTTDADCGAMDSGVVCGAGTCEIGCRGEGGNGCPDGLECTSTTDEIGLCERPSVITDGGIEMPDAGGSGGASGSGGSGGAGSGGRLAEDGIGRLGGGGCDCRTTGEGRSMNAVPVLLALLLIRRRRRRTS
jgi:uncharacterized repeat protein (TIGR01451 family)/MYXO-CTERM domain-containing protein